MKLRYFGFLVLVCLAAYTCKSNMGSDAQKLPTITSFSATPETIAKGESVTLRWSIKDALAASIDHGVGPINVDANPANGERVVSPTENTTYTLTVSNGAGSVTKTASVTVK
jgi:hypothetical protein